MQRKRDPLATFKSNQRLFAISSIALLLGLVGFTPAYGGVSQQRFIPAGTYVPFFISRDPTKKSTAETVRKPTPVPAFWMDSSLVTNKDFLEFVKKHRDWRRSQIARVFADESYLKHWRSDVVLNKPADLDQPVTNVSWFAAAAFCHSRDKELPTTDQWEYAIEDAGRHSEDVKKKILSWYSAPNPKVLREVKQHSPNGYGIYDLYGLIWEWTQDFNSAMIGSELRSDGTKDENLFCGAGSASATDASDYVKFMRYSFRSSLRADYTTANLGFRCAREEKK